MTIDRRQFLTWAASTALASRWSERTRERAPFPFVDGLSFIASPADIAASGLSAFLCDVSAAFPIKTTDGSIKYFRSYDASRKSLLEMRKRLNGGAIPGAFLATKGSSIASAYRDGRAAVFFQFQGAEPIGHELDKLGEFYELGLRVQQITHHNDNAWGGGALERSWTGLTKTGFEGVERLNALGIIPDLAHVADPSSLDVLRTSKKPVIVSHGGARAIVNNARCTPDAVIKGVADSGGLMGVFMMTCWLTLDARPTTESYLSQIRHIVNVGGIDAVGIANDYPIGGYADAIRVGNDNARAAASMFAWWDGIARQGVLGFDRRPAHMVIPELNNVRRAFLINDALERARFTATEREKIMGGNWIRVLSGTLG